MLMELLPHEEDFVSARRIFVAWQIFKKNIIFDVQNGSVQHLFSFSHWIHWLQWSAVDLVVKIIHLFFVCFLVMFSYVGSLTTQLSIYLFQTSAQLDHSFFIPQLVSCSSRSSRLFVRDCAFESRSAGEITTVFIRKQTNGKHSDINYNSYFFFLIMCIWILTIKW